MSVGAELAKDAAIVGLDPLVGEAALVVAYAVAGTRLEMGTI